MHMINCNYTLSILYREFVGRGDIFMKRILPELDPFRLIQTSVNHRENRPTEAVMSLGNGYMGARGNYEEDYTGDTLKGIYVAGVWMPDKTRVGWWKNGYPRYYGKVINAPDFLMFHLYVNGDRVDLALADIETFRRTVDMQTGVMDREMVVRTQAGRLRITSSRFFSIDTRQIACMSYQVQALDDTISVVIETGLDANVKNADANYGEQFWEVNTVDAGAPLYLESETIENTFDVPRFAVGFSALTNCTSGGVCHETVRSDRSVFDRFEANLSSGDTIHLDKIVSVVTTRDMEHDLLRETGAKILSRAVADGPELLRARHSEAWRARWEKCDVEIEGDVAAQQGIRFNLFQLWSTYDGSDERLNIGPKGFTGEKYGGAAYYDTEGYCFPMYLATASPEIALSLLKFRFNILDKAKENARRIGMRGALYPMVTFDGEECHNEWEITFEELHRNAAMIHAIYNYTCYTGDESYIRDFGIHVMVEVARFWVCRASYNPRKDCYMLLGVTAPNEYENNINNNFLTNFMAKWCIEYALEYVEKFDYPLPDEEAKLWREVAEKMYINYDEKTNLFIQQDGFMDKDLVPASQIPEEELPLCKHWSWDRILRSCFIKQADVVLAFYYLPHRFTLKQKQANFRFYEPFTVHESSLSPSMYSTVASMCGFTDDAYRLYQRAARLDLDNFNADTEDGLHITSMAGSWIALTHGFAGMDYQRGVLSFSPRCPEHWKQLKMRLVYKGRLLEVCFNAQTFHCSLLEGDPLPIEVNGVPLKVETSLDYSLS